MKRISVIRGPSRRRVRAITLLADSVEGATRALDEHNPTNIEETVKRLLITNLSTASWMNVTSP